MARTGIVVAALAWLLGPGIASACQVSGQVVCAGTDQGVDGAVVIFTHQWGGAFSDTTEGGGIYSMPVYENEEYTVTIDLTGIGGGIQPVEGTWARFVPVDPSPYGDTVFTFDFQVSAPGCEAPPPPPPPPADADCSSGFYKKHPEAWCDQCGYDAQACYDALVELNANGAGSVVRRDAQKSEIDACFDAIGGAAGVSGAEASPCRDDNL